MIKVQVRFASYLQDITGAKEITWRLKEEMKVMQLMEDLIDYYGEELKYSIYEKDGTQKPQVRIMLNGRDIRFLEKEELILYDGDIVLILPALAGG